MKCLLFLTFYIGFSMYLSLSVRLVQYFFSCCPFFFVPPHCRYLSSIHLSLLLVSSRPANARIWFMIVLYCFIVGFSEGSDNTLLMLDYKYGIRLTGIFICRFSSASVGLSAQMYAWWVSSSRNKGNFCSQMLLC
jgi:hypothetical protein